MKPDGHLTTCSSRTRGWGGEEPQASPRSSREVVRLQLVLSAGKRLLQVR